MDFGKVNLAGYKIVCAAGMVVFAVIGFRILLDILYIRAMIVLVSAAALALLRLQRPSPKNWLQVLLIGTVALITINNIDKI